MTSKKGYRAQEILQALARMLEVCQGGRITTAALASELGVSEAALYRHFPSKTRMFAGSSGSISQAMCTTATTFSSKAKLKSAVDASLKLSPKGDCSNGPHGPIGEWDISSVTDMSDMFSGATFFNGDISQWDVSRVTGMTYMFMGAVTFSADISKWDVSNGKYMQAMFYAKLVGNESRIKTSQRSH